jgi:asparagine synthase (glutamine-hydrolysing)
MCGINGFNFTDARRTELMNEAIRYRGPDDDGVFTDQAVSLGNVRLSILDLSNAGRQPMMYRHEDDVAIIVYNGEIYNFWDLRHRLEDKGYTFNSRTDTEVVLASYLESGYDCVTAFDGMWAFVIYDPAKRTLFCSRDRAGKKPLYYYYYKDRFVFSSELRGILTHDYLCLNKIENINREAVDLYFGLGFIPSPYTIYNNTFKLEARQNLIFDLATRQMRKWYYCGIPNYEPVYDRERLIQEGKGLLRDAVRLRMIADVPVGVFLSGGLDSSSTVAFVKELRDARDLHTFSIGFEGDYDETQFVEIARKHFGTNHHHYIFTEQDFEQLLETYATIFDEPLSDFSCFPTYILCKKAREHVTVVLSGDGGDEVFGGYPEHVMGYRMDVIKKMPKLVRTILSKMPARKNLTGYASLFLLKKAFGASLLDPTLFYARALEGDIAATEIVKQWKTEKLRLCLPHSGSSMAEMLRLYDLMFNTLADNYLAKTDRVSMANSLEVRCPLLDYRLVEFSQKIPAEYKVDLFRTKKLMRAVIKDIVPAEIAHRQKHGFAVPIADWISSQTYEAPLVHSLKYLRVLSPEMCRFFCDRVLKESNRLYRTYRGRLLLFGKWMDRWIVDSDTV